MIKLSLIVITFFSLALNAGFFFKYIWKSPTPRRQFSINLSLLIMTCLGMLIGLEIFFRGFVRQSDGFNFTLSSEKWFDQYWRPINSQGYRDFEHDDLQGKRALFVVGDSFVSGHGIKRYQDTFPQVLADKLPDPWEVINLSQPDWGTSKEYEAMVSYPRKPELIVMSYYPNDIEDAANKTGKKRPEFIKAPSKALKYFIDRSYFLNFVYWRIYRFTAPMELTEGYRHYLPCAYSYETVWGIDQEELYKIIQFARENQSDLMFLVFPQYTFNSVITVNSAKVIDFLRSQGIKVIDLAPLFEGKDIRQLIVSAVDIHPNERLHREVGEMLFREIAQVTREQELKSQVHKTQDHRTQAREYTNHNKQISLDPEDLKDPKDKQYQMEQSRKSGERD